MGVLPDRPLGRGPEEVERSLFVVDADLAVGALRQAAAERLVGLEHAVEIDLGGELTETREREAHVRRRGHRGLARRARRRPRPS